MRIAAKGRKAQGKNSLEGDAWMTPKEAYEAGRKFAREHKMDIDALLLYRQGLIDEVMSWDYRVGNELLARKVKGGKKHAGKAKG